MILHGTKEVTITKMKLFKNFNTEMSKLEAKSLYQGETGIRYL